MFMDPETLSMDTSIPNVARCYDYLLEGRNSFVADQVVVDKALAFAPEIRPMAKANRALGQRMVRYLADAGIRRFLDIGAGLPTEGQVHEIAQQIHPDAHVVYVDYDEVVLLLAQAMLVPHPNVSIIRADVRDPDGILRTPEVQALLEPGEPVGLLLFAVMHVVEDDEVAYGSVTRLIDALPAGSFMAMSHTTTDIPDPEQLRKVARLYQPATQARPRPRADIERFFDGLKLVEPGVVFNPRWRPDDPDTDVADGWNLAGMGVKRS